MQASRWIRYAERGCLTILFAWLAWLPLPFGSVVERARLPLIVVPLVLCTFAALLRLYATRDRLSTAMPTRPLEIWFAGGVLFLAFAALQLIPLGASLLRALSPDSFAIWNDATRVASLGGVTPRTAWPLTVDPQATVSELFRIAAIVATFLTAAMLIRNHAARRVLAAVLCAAAMFEALYGLREAALQRYEIWGWVNRLIFHRVTGTFVNPNHFAHYIAIILPMALFLGASVVIVGDMQEDRLKQAESFGCQTVNVDKGDAKEQVEQILGVPEVDCFVDAVGFEAHGEGGEESPAVVLNQAMDLTRAAGRIGIPGLYVTEDPGAEDEEAQKGNLSMNFGLGWAKSHSFFTGQTPVMKYHRGLMQAILSDRVQIAKAVNATVITLDEAPKGYEDFDSGAARKFVLNPNGLIPA